MSVTVIRGCFQTSFMYLKIGRTVGGLVDGRVFGDGLDAGRRPRRRALRVRPAPLRRTSAWDFGREVCVASLLGETIERAIPEMKDGTLKHEAAYKKKFKKGQAGYTFLSEA